MASPEPRKGMYASNARRGTALKSLQSGEKLLDPKEAADMLDVSDKEVMQIADRDDPLRQTASTAAVSRFTFNRSSNAGGGSSR